MFANRKQSRGVTILELVVVVSIIGMLVALLLPAVQSARDAARRLSCQNNLRNIGLAAVGFETTYQRFPPGYVGSKYNNLNDPNCTWIGSLAYLLPFLEQGSVFKTIESERDLGVDAILGTSELSVENWWNRNDACLDTSRYRFPMFECPSDSGIGSEGVLATVHVMRTSGRMLIIGRQELAFERTGKLGVSNYLGSSGFAGGTGNLFAMRGVFFNRSKTSNRDILDGTSNTLLYGEVTGAWNHLQKPMRKTHSFAWMGSGAIPLVRGLEVKKQFDAFGSMHSGGLVSFVFVDGSTRSLAQGTSLDVLISISSMANGDLSGNGSE